MNYLRQFYDASKTSNTADEKQNCRYELLATLGMGEIETEQETLLYGGNVTGAARVGQTVRRVTGCWSTTVHDLLRHLEASGFTGAPRFVGIDEQGREILTFIKGEVGHYPLPRSMWSDES